MGEATKRVPKNGSSVAFGPQAFCPLAESLVDVLHSARQLETSLPAPVRKLFQVASVPLRCRRPHHPVTQRPISLFRSLCLLGCSRRTLPLSSLRPCSLWARQGGPGHPARGHALFRAALSAVGGVAFKRRARWDCFQRLTSRGVLSAGLQSLRGHPMMTQSPQARRRAAGLRRMCIIFLETVRPLAL